MEQTYHALVFVLGQGTGVINRYIVLETAFSQGQNVIVPDSEHSGPWP